jgi:hypothetical protein
VNVVMNLRVPYNAGNYRVAAQLVGSRVVLSSTESVGYSSRSVRLFLALHVPQVDDRCCRRAQTLSQVRMLVRSGLVHSQGYWRAVVADNGSWSVRQQRTVRIYSPENTPENTECCPLQTHFTVHHVRRTGCFLVLASNGPPPPPTRPAAPKSILS